MERHRRVTGAHSQDRRERERERERERLATNLERMPSAVEW
jgi:hypothetical protein